jgi:hypothetical protein
VLLVLAAWTAFTALQICVSVALAKAGEVRWGRELIVDLTMAVYWTLVTFPVAAWHRRVRASGAGLGRMMVAHVPLLVLAIIGDTYSARLTLELITGFTPPNPAITTITYFADFDTLSYLAIVIVTDALLARKAVRAEEQRGTHLESLLARARLEYLEAQLQPHFLFNALGAVSELAYEAPAAALRVLRQLALIFRGALTARPGEVTLGEELVAIEPYLDIQRIRFPDWLRIEYDVGGNTLDCLVPRFVLQPLVENAIRHGLTGRVAAGCIEISSRVADGRLVLRVADNGVGLRRQGSRSGYGIGLTNVRERLTTLYGAGEQLRLLDAPGGGAVAEVTLPTRRATDPSSMRAEPAGEDLADLVPSESVTARVTIHEPRPPLHRIARAVALWTGCGLLWTMQSYAYLRMRDRLGKYTLLSLARHDVAAALLWCGIAPIVFSAASRFPLTRSHAVARTTAYVAGTAILALAHAWILERVFTPQMQFWSTDNSNTFILNFLILAVLVGVGHRWQLGEWMRERELAAAALSTELRAARLRAARLQEIPPVVLRALERVIEAVGAVPSPRRTEQLLARLGDYLRVAIECSDEHGITPSREQSLARSLAQFERVARAPITSSSLTSP